MQVFVWSRICGVWVGLDGETKTALTNMSVQELWPAYNQISKRESLWIDILEGRKWTKNARNQIWSKWKVCGLISCWNDKIYSQSAIWCRIKGASGWIWASWWICCEGNQGSSKTSPQRYLLHTPSFKKTLSCQNIEEHWMRNNNMRKSNPIWNHEITLLKGLFALDLARPFLTSDWVTLN